MSDFSIKVEGLSKKYDLRKKRQDTFVDTLGQMFSNNGKEENTLWALRDVSFEIQQGEILGIIGQNGAGKSTLLKILSEITEPTEGMVAFNGKVSSVLEIGTGFNQELTGRENIYMSGALLGMNKKEVDKALPEILKFSGIGKFADTPVKHYSSGMFIRLAFSVAANLDADILLLDEILSVGDSEFGIKSLNRIRQLVKQGKTIVIVSHDLGSVGNICDKCLLLEKGKVKAFGPPNQLITGYLEDTLIRLQKADQKEDEQDDLNEEVKRLQSELEQKERALKSAAGKEAELNSELERARKELEDSQAKANQGVDESKLKDDQQLAWTLENAPGNENIKLLELGVDSTNGGDVYMDDEITISMKYRKTVYKPLNVGLVVVYQLSSAVFSLNPFMSKTGNTDNSKVGVYEAKCRIPGGLLNSGFFTIDVFVTDANEQLVFNTEQLLSFRIKHRETDGEGFQYHGTYNGPLLPSFDWEVQRIGEA